MWEPIFFFNLYLFEGVLFMVTINFWFLAGSLLALAILVAYLHILFRLAGSKKDRQDLFYLLLYAPYLIGIVFLIYSLVVSGVVLPLFWVLLFFLFVVERVVWGVSLYEVAGEDRVAWFAMIYFFSPLLWIIYQFQKLG